MIPHSSELYTPTLSTAIQGSAPQTEPLPSMLTPEHPGSDRLLPMSGPTLQQRLNHLLEILAEAEREYAAGVPYPDHTGGSWTEKISRLKQHIAELREIIANE